jgi:hypothetical protein
MMTERTNPEEILTEMGIELPEAPAPATSYLPYVQTGNLILTAGQIAVDGGEFVAEGIVGQDVTLEEQDWCEDEREVLLSARPARRASAPPPMRRERKVRLRVRGCTVELRRPDNVKSEHAPLCKQLASSHGASLGGSYGRTCSRRSRRCTHVSPR